MQLYIKLNLKVICCFLFQQERFTIELYIQLLHTPSLSSSSISLSLICQDLREGSYYVFDEKKN